MLIIVNYRILKTYAVFVYYLPLKQTWYKAINRHLRKIILTATNFINL